MHQKARNREREGQREKEIFVGCLLLKKHDSQLSGNSKPGTRNTSLVSSTSGRDQTLGLSSTAGNWVRSESAETQTSMEMLVSQG